MRTTTFVSLLGAAALAAVAGCVKDVDQPALAGPSTFAHSIIMVADRDTLTQNGVDFTDIRITSLSARAASRRTSRCARRSTSTASPQDFGTLSTKTPITPTTIRYTAPPAVDPRRPARSPTTVTIAVTPATSGDFRGENIRQIDIRLTPQGIILPTNPNLVGELHLHAGLRRKFSRPCRSMRRPRPTAALRPAAPRARIPGTSATARRGRAQTTTHQFRTINNFSVTLTVTDARGATAFVTKVVPVGAGTPPTAVVHDVAGEPRRQPGRVLQCHGVERLPRAGRSRVTTGHSATARPAQEW